VIRLVAAALIAAGALACAYVVWVVGRIEVVFDLTPEHRRLLDGGPEW
jgi:hypothetical protein